MGKAKVSMLDIGQSVSHHIFSNLCLESEMLETYNQQFCFKSPFVVGWLDSSKHKAKDGVILHSHLDQIKLFKISNKIK